MVKSTGATNRLSAVDARHARGGKQLDQVRFVSKAIWRKMLAALAEREVAQLQNLLHRCIRGLEDQVEDARPAKPAARSRQKDKEKASRQLTRPR